MKTIVNHTLALLLLSQAEATEDNLWITEVLPDTGEIEVTNVGAEAFTTTRNLPFCHRFNYRTSVPSGTTFAAGQSRIYTVSFSDSTASDLWLYRPGGFGNSANVISGLQWNTTSLIGRSLVATNGGKWDGGTSSAPGPAAGQSIQLTGDNPFSAENWTVGPPNLGTFAMAGEEPLPIALGIARVEDTLVLTWEGGAPPYQLESGTTLEDFTPLGEPTDALTATVPLGDERRFYRVVSMAPLPQTARFRIELSSLWSGLTFNMTPSDPTFGGLIGTTHSDQISFWSPGSLASNGVADLAREGSLSSLTAELGIAVGSGLASEIIVQSGVDDELGTSSFEMTVDRDFPLLTLLSKLNESPDWFTGIRNVSLLEEDGRFRDRIEIMLMPWDAGVDSGFSYGGAEQVTSPAEPISSLADNFIFSPSLLLGPDVGQIPVGGLIIERLPEE